MTLFDAWKAKEYPMPPFQILFEAPQTEDEDFPEDHWTEDGRKKVLPTIVEINAVIFHISKNVQPAHFSDISFVETQEPIPGNIEIQGIKVRQGAKKYKF